MRLISTFKDQKLAYNFSLFLQENGIENQLEFTPNTDWGSSEYGDIDCKVWIKNEEDLDTALDYANSFKENPNDPKFQLKGDSTNIFQELQQPSISNPNALSENPDVQSSQKPTGNITIFLAVLCALLLWIGSSTTPAIKSFPNYLPHTPILSPPINKELMYDYPLTFELTDRLIEKYGLESLSNFDTLPQTGKNLVEQILQTPYWKGFYDKVLLYIKQPEVPITFDAPLFEKIRQGEFWRTFTPCLLHSDIFHLFFNMVWLIVLGQQMEKRMGKKRYIFFILIVGIFSNTLQYLMSGSSFVGFSGVLTGMLAFIWVRQKKAGWEGYQLERGTLIFIAFFVLFMFSLQLLSFLLEAFTDHSLPIGIANTAHLAGAFAGYFLAKSNFFAWK